MRRPHGFFRVDFNRNLGDNFVRLPRLQKAMMHCGPSADDDASRSFYHFPWSSCTIDSKLVEVCDLNLAAGLQDVENFLLVVVK